MSRSSSSCASVIVVSMLGLAACGSNHEDATAADSGTAAPEVHAAGKNDWPMLGGSLASTFHNTAETKLSIHNVAKLTEKWTLKTAGAPNGTPALVGKALYVTSASKTYRLDADSGKPKWSIPFGASSSPTYADGILYVNGTTLNALDPETGTSLWQKTLDDNPNYSGFSSPVVAGDLVIVGTSSSEEILGSGMPKFRGSIVAFDRKKGTPMWRHYTVDDKHFGATVWSTVSVDLDAGMVFVSTGNNYAGEDSGTSDSILALDLETGDEMWHTQVSKDDIWSLFQPDSTDSDFGTNPILFEATIDGEPRKLVGAGQKSGIFWAMDRMTGDIVWSQTLSEGTELTGGMLNNGAFDGERILVASNTGTSKAAGSEADRKAAPGGGTSRLAALDPRSGKILWERQLGAYVWGPISVANGVGFVSSENQVEAFDAKTGKRLYTLEVEGTVTTAAVVSNGRVFFGSGMSYLKGIAGSTFYALALP